MIRDLAVLQLPFLFLTSMLACIGVYWMAPEVTDIYAGVVVALVGLHLVLARFRERLLTPGVSLGIFLAGVAAAAWVYRPLHLGYWDEESARQALAVGALGLLSLGAGHAAARASGRGRYSLAGALATIGLIWALALDYPAIPLLAVGLVLAVALPFARPAPAPSPAVGKVDRPMRLWLARWVILLAAMELAGVIWDFQQDLSWAGHLSAGFLAAALTAAFGVWKPGRALALGAVAAGGVFLATWLLPDFVLHPAHSLGAGVALGAALSFLVERRGPDAILGATLPWGAGLILSLLLAQHLPYAGWRLVLLLPVLILPFLDRAAASPDAPATAPVGA